MTHAIEASRARLTAPRAAAVAGILFSVLDVTSLVLIRVTVPANPHDAGAWLSSGMRSAALALHLLPFAGIAFLWFIGVLRDRLGEREDRFFATVFFGSGLLFLAMMFVSAGVAGGLLRLYSSAPTRLIDSGLYNFGRTATYEMMNLYTIKMAGVFMMSTSTLAIRTGFIARWIAYLGFALALFLLLSLGIFDWAPVVFPLWVLVLSIDILVLNLRTSGAGTANAPHPACAGAGSAGPRGTV